MTVVVRLCHLGHRRGCQFPAAVLAGAWPAQAVCTCASLSRRCFTSLINAAIELCCSYDVVHERSAGVMQAANSGCCSTRSPAPGRLRRQSPSNNARVTRARASIPSLVQARHSVRAQQCKCGLFACASVMVCCVAEQSIQATGRASEAWQANLVWALPSWRVGCGVHERARGCPHLAYGRMGIGECAPP
jgi:hypothetical protein